ncbi:MAG: bifunctional nicotinamidase/pyrazinamidase [Bacteroidota bacterium]
MNALILVDLQVDFCTAGALEVPHGEEVIPIANRLMSHFPLVIATQDWHPADHGSFAANHLWRKPGQIIDLHGLEQILWPIHCVQNTFGATFHRALQQDKIHHIVQKGTDKTVDSYSGFFDNGRRKATGLKTYLRDKGVETLYIMGLATDYCVKYTVMDALDLGFKVHLISDGCRGIDLNPGDIAKAMADMEAGGALITSSDALIQMAS